jgi:hypothetical protein
LIRVFRVQIDPADLREVGRREVERFPWSDDSPRETFLNDVVVTVDSRISFEDALEHAREVARTRWAAELPPPEEEPGPPPAAL